MKTKDIVMLSVALLIFVVAGFLAYTQLLPKSSSAPKGVRVEVVGNIPASMDQDALSTLNNSSMVKDYDSPVDLSGLNNSAPFGQ